MTAVRFTESFKYGLVIFGYFVALAVVGLGGIALGGVLAVPEVLSWWDGDGYGTAELAGGGVLMALGATVWFTGIFAIIRKLLADAVSAGVAHGQGDITLELEGFGDESVAPTRHISREDSHGGDRSTETESTASQESETGGSQTNKSETAPTADSGETVPSETEPATEDTVPRTETEAGERGWTGDTAEPDRERPSAGAKNTKDDSDSDEDADGETQPKQTAEEIAFGQSSARDEKTGNEDGEEQDGTATEGAPSGASDETGGKTPDPATDMWETEDDSEGGADDDVPVGDEEDRSPGASNDADEEQSKGANDSNSDPLADRLSKE